MRSHSYSSALTGTTNGELDDIIEAFEEATEARLSVSDNGLVITYYLSGSAPVDNKDEGLNYLHFNLMIIHRRNVGSPNTFLLVTGGSPAACESVLKIAKEKSRIVPIDYFPSHADTRQPGSERYLFEPGLTRKLAP